MVNRLPKFIFDSFKGRNRPSNKDDVLLISEEYYHIFGIFDGVSSAVGAKKAVNFAIKYIKRNHQDYYINGRFFLSMMLKDLNIALSTTIINDPFTTCSLVYFPHDSRQKIKLLNIGDSRIYSVTKQYLLQLTEDNNDPIYSNILTKYLGYENLKDVIETEYKEEDERSILICTDGFYTVMEKSSDNLAEIHRVLNLKSLYYIQNGIKKVIYGLNKDDASYVYVRWDND